MAMPLLGLTNQNSGYMPAISLRKGSQCGMSLSPPQGPTQGRSVNPYEKQASGKSDLPPQSGASGVTNPVETLLSAEDLPAPQGYPAGIDLYRQGREPREAFLIKSGAVKLSQTDAPGRELIAGLRLAGEAVGVASVCLGQPYPETATTINRCEIIRLPTALLIEQMGSNEAVKDYVVAELSRNYYYHAEVIARSLIMMAKERVMDILLQLSNATAGNLPSDGVRVPPILKDWELALFAGVSPQRYSQLLSELETAGLIRRKKGALTIIGAKSRL